MVVCLIPVSLANRVGFPACLTAFFIARSTGGVILIVQTFQQMIYNQFAQNITGKTDFSSRSKKNRNFFEKPLDLFA